MTTQKEILKDRVEAKKKELEARLASLKADSKASTSKQIDEVRQAIDDLGEAIKHGWDNMTERAAARVNQLLGSESKTESESESDQP